MQIIKSIAIAELSNVIHFIDQHNGKVSVNVLGGWTNLNIHPASGLFNSNSKESAAGTYYVTDITARLKHNISVRKALLKIEMCDGESLVLGTPQVPVSFQINKNLNISKLVISHNSAQAPMILI